MTRVIIRDINKNFCVEALKVGFQHVENVDITTKKASCVVSPANSFGFMDGGVDAAYSRRFHGIQEKVQDAIERQGGELVVGNAFALSTEDEEIPLLIVAPTMRVPSVITDILDIYLSTRAAMREWLFVVSNIEDLDKDGIAFPGMGTGCGNVDFIVAARAMKCGIDDAIRGLEYPSSTAHMISMELELRNRIRHG